MSILYLAHGHPRFARGGGELASYRLFEAIRSRRGFEQTGFLAAVPDQGLLPPGCEIMSIDQNEWLISGSSNSLMHDTTVQLTQDARGAVYEALSSFPFRSDSCPSLCSYRIGSLDRIEVLVSILSVSADFA